VKKKTEKKGLGGWGGEDGKATRGKIPRKGPLSPLKSERMPEFSRLLKN